MTRETELTEAFASLAGTLVDDYDIVELLQRLVHYCVTLLDVSAAGLMLNDQRGSLRVMTSTSRDIEDLEVGQLKTGGPCVDAVEQGRHVSCSDLDAAGQQWPEFSAAATAAGYRSVHAVPLRLSGQVIGAMNLFHIEPGEFTLRDQRIAQALTDVATVSLLQHDRGRRSPIVARQLQAAHNARATLAQAAGLTAQLADIELETAYRSLTTYAERRGQHLIRLARLLVEERDGATLADFLNSVSAER